MKRNFIPLTLLLLGTTTYSQVGIGTQTPNISSALDVVSDSKGILIPRVSLNNSTDNTTITSGNINSLLIFNTASNNDVNPGYYYWFENKWMRITNTDDVIALDSNTTNSNFEILNESLILNDSDGNNISILLENLNLSTEIINNNDGTYTFINEHGDEFIINIIGNVVTNIQNEGAVYDEIINILQANSDTFVDNGNGTFTHTAVDGTTVTFNSITTTLVNNNDGTYTFTNVNGDSVTINVVGDVVTNIQNEGAVYDEIINILQANSDIFVDNGNGTFTHTTVDGSSVSFNANTLNISSNNGVFTFTDASNNVVGVIDTNANQIIYNDTVTNLNVTNVQDAISSLLTRIQTIETTKGNLTGNGILINGNATEQDALLKNVSLSIADNSISTSKLVDDSVTASKINQDVAGNGLTQNSTTGALDVNPDATATLLGKNLAAEDSSIIVTNGTGAVLVGANLKVAEGGITTNKLADNSVTNLKLAESSVNSSNIIDGTISDQDIANKTITSNKFDATGQTAGHVATVNSNGTVSYSAVTTESISDKKTITSTGPIKVNASNSVANATLADVAITVDNASGTNLGVVKEAATNPTVLIASDGALNVNLSQLAGDGLIADSTNNLLNVSANNGVSVDSATDKVQLGGSLVQPTEIVTTSSNTLAIKGLQTGTTSEKILVVNESSGVVKQIDQSSVAIEPWNIQGTSNKAIENTENIYQQGNVAIGINNSVTKQDKLYVLGEVTFENDFKESTVITNDAKSSSVVNQSSTDFYANVNVKNNDIIDGRSYIHVNAGQEDTDTNAYIPEIVMTAGSDHLKSQLYGEYSMNVLKSNKLSGIGVHNFIASSTLNNGVENTFVSIDEKGLKIGTFDDAGANNDRIIRFNGYTGASVANTYYLPKSAPLEKQVLTFESYEVTSGVSTTKTKWENIEELISEPWNVQGGTNKATSNSENIYQMGNVAIGVDNVPNASVNNINPKLYVEGNIHVNGSLYTTNSVYADYVFEKYFNGFSEIKNDYNFPKLSQVKDFIKKNHHLPGVTPIGDLKKTESGYVIDYSKLSIEQLEKIEELYIHVINQQETIDRQENLIKSQEIILNEYQKRLEVLEEYLLKDKK